MSFKCNENILTAPECTSRLLLTWQGPLPQLQALGSVFSPSAPNLPCTVLKTAPYHVTLLCSLTISDSSLFTELTLIVQS